MLIELSIYSGRQLSQPSVTDSQPTVIDSQPPDTDSQPTDNYCNLQTPTSTYRHLLQPTFDNY